jgi:hypothetical protein
MHVCVYVCMLIYVCTYVCMYLLLDRGHEETLPSQRFFCFVDILSTNSWACTLYLHYFVVLLHQVIFGRLFYLVFLSFDETLSASANALELAEASLAAQSRVIRRREQLSRLNKADSPTRSTEAQVCVCRHRQTFKIEY